MNGYFADVGSYPRWVWSAWGQEVGLADRGSVPGSHLSSWNGPYLQDWPQKTAWGGGNVGCGAQGGYYVHPPIGWIEKDGVGGNDRCTHMTPYCNQYPPAMAIQIDKAMDDGNPGSGNMRLTGGWPEYVYSYVGEGTTSW